MSTRTILESLLPEALSQKILEQRWKQKQKRLKEAPFFADYPPKTDPMLINGRARISAERSYVYFRVPKAANSAIAANMIYYEEGIGVKDRDAIAKFKLSNQRLGDLTKSEVSDIISNYYKFTVVRNPYSRLISAYSEKIQGNKHYHRKKVERFLRKAPGDYIKLSEFLDFLEFEGSIHSDGHWARQTDLIAIPISKLDFIGKCETLSSDLPKIMTRLYNRFEKPLDYAPHATGSDKKVEACDTQTLNRIYKIYEQDFDLLEYPREAKRMV